MWNSEFNMVLKVLSEAYWGQDGLEINDLLDLINLAIYIKLDQADSQDFLKSNWIEVHHIIFFVHKDLRDYSQQISLHKFKR